MAWASRPDESANSGRWYRTLGKASKTSNLCDLASPDCWRQLLCVKMSCLLPPAQRSRELRSVPADRPAEWRLGSAKSPPAQRSLSLPPSRRVATARVRASVSRRRRAVGSYARRKASAAPPISYRSFAARCDKTRSAHNWRGIGVTARFNRAHTYSPDQGQFGALSQVFLPRSQWFTPLATDCRPSGAQTTDVSSRNNRHCSRTRGCGR